MLHDHVEPVLHEFKELFDSGFLELVNKTDGYGKLLENLKKRYVYIYLLYPFTLNFLLQGDSAARVLWRSKESLDFAFLADYAHHYGGLLITIALYKWHYRLFFIFGGRCCSSNQFYT